MVAVGVTTLALVAECIETFPGGSFQSAESTIEKDPVTHLQLDLLHPSFPGLLGLL